MTRPLGRISWRKLFSVATGFLVTIFAYLLLTAPVAYAADITWKDGGIVYQNNTYRGPTVAADKDGHELPVGSILYTYNEPTVPFTPPKVNVIYFPPGTQTQVATEARHVTYELNPGGGLSNKSDSRTLTIDTASQPEAQDTPRGEGGSCQVDGNLGWIICPVANTLAIGMDWIFRLITQFLEVRPLVTTGGQPNIMMPMWNMMRNFANVAFVVAFMIIIYSQLTSWGISNYGIKKILPRLVVAAVLVNISFWICAIAIDLSNILGYSLQALFINMRELVLQDTGANGWQLVDWQTLMSFILAGGAATVGAAAGWVALSAKLAAFSVTGVVLLILPILMSAFLIVMVVLFILAARQAIITLLVILAPLAFVAYILPNTEKWFERWRETFMTMMLFFPAFSLVFGGAQFAGLAVIQNAQNISMVILGMAIQIAPLAITPLILKFSGSLLGRIAGMVNDPRKGLVDRTRNWADERLQAKRAAQMSKTRQMLQDGTLKRRHGMRRTALYTDTSRRLREGMKAIHDEDADTLFNASDEGYQLSRAKEISGQLKNTIENTVKTKLQSEINLKDTELHVSNVKLEASKIELEDANSKTSAILEEYKANRPLSAMPELTALSQRMHDATENISLHALRSESAKRHQSATFTDNLKENKTQIDGINLQEYAGGIEQITGAQRALASSINQQSKAHNDAISNAKTIIKHGNYADATITKFALGDSANTNITVTDDIREAAIEMVFSGGNATEILSLARQIELTPQTQQDLRQSAGETLLSNSSRPKFIGAGMTAAMKEGAIPAPGKARIDQWVVQTTNANKLSSAEVMVTQDKEYLQAILDAVKNNTSNEIFDTTKLASMMEHLYVASTDHRFSGRIGERKEILRELYDELHQQVPNSSNLKHNGNPLPRNILQQ